MSIKDFIPYIIGLVSTIATAVITFSFAKRKSDADTKKVSLDNRNVEEKWEDDRYQRLLLKVIEYEKHVDEYDLRLQEMSKRILEQDIKIQELTAQLTIYRTTKPNHS